MPRPHYWLMKSEPEVFSIQDLVQAGRASWEGVRNYQARNFMRDDMRVGDLALFYHSNGKPPGVAGVCRIVRAAYPDHHAWDPGSPYYDPRATREQPRWVMVDVEPVQVFPHFVSRPAMKEDAALAEMMVLRKGARLSIQPVSEGHFRRVLELGAGA